jgi:hypothetical protein
MVLLVTLNVYTQPTLADRHIEKYRGQGWARDETESPMLARWVQERTTAGDTIWDFGFHTELYFYADRRSPSRFMFDHPLAYNEEYAAQAIADLEAGKPAYILDTSVYEEQTDVKPYVTSVREWIEENYEYVGKVYYADVFRRPEGLQ